MRVPFGRARRLGVVLGTGEAPSGIELKPAWDRLDADPWHPAAYRHWLHRLRRYYLAPPGLIWETALHALNAEMHARYLCPRPEALPPRCPALRDAFHGRRPISMQTLLRRVDATADLCQQLRWALEASAIEALPVNPPWLTNDGAKSPLPSLNDEQRAAVQTVHEQRRGFRSFLLFGRTGSGKTEVYLELARRYVNEGGQVLILVPEIGLTPMWTSRLARRFSRVLVWHSALSATQRLSAIRHLNQAEVVIGTRSALFLPLPRLAMIVVDEEHDLSFKQQEGLCYSARDAALLLAQQLEIPVVLGSATPSLESWRQAKEGTHRLLRLRRQAVARHAPNSEVIDMRRHEKAILSPPLLRALRDVHERGEQSILFLNRRGYAPALQCTACGHIAPCPACSLRLSLHRKQGKLRCHVCGFERAAPRCCEACGEAALLPLGSGTERIDEELQQHIPNLRIERFDRDSVASHARLVEVLRRFEHGEIDCLIGTQMLVKGHDFHNVTLVGVVHADMGLSIPDFRANERWWQQMTQVMGRAGRGAKAGQVLIQTWMPDAPWLQCIGEWQAEQALDTELALRRQLGFPPFARWVRMVFSGRKEARVRQTARDWQQVCERIPGIQVMPAGPCPLERQAHRYRFEILLRDAEKKRLPWALEPVLQNCVLPFDVRCRVDVDPMDML